MKSQDHRAKIEFGGAIRGTHTHAHKSNRGALPTRSVPVHRTQPCSFRAPSSPAGSKLSFKQLHFIVGVTTRPVEGRRCGVWDVYFGQNYLRTIRVGQLIPSNGECIKDSSPPRQTRAQSGTDRLVWAKKGWVSFPPFFLMDSSSILQSGLNSLSYEPPGARKGWGGLWTCPCLGVLSGGCKRTSDG